MASGMVDGVGGTDSGIRLWRDRVGFGSMLTDHYELGSGENVLDVSDNVSLTLANRHTRKRKMVPTGGPDAVITLYGNKRNKHEYIECSGTSFDSHSHHVLGTNPREMPINCVLSSLSNQQNIELESNYTDLLGANVVGSTSYWSTDDYNAGDDEHSWGGTSTYNSSEGGFSQQCLHYHDTFVMANRNISEFYQAGKQSDDSWSEGSKMLQLQLGSFIQKERQKLESDLEVGSSGFSQHSLTPFLRGYGSVEPVTRMANEQLSGNSDLLSGMSCASRSFIENRRTQYRGGVIHSSNASSLLLSCVRNKKLNGFVFPMKKNHEVARESEEPIVLSDAIREYQRSPFSFAHLEKDVYNLRSTELHQKFVLSSGRPSHVEAVQVDTRVSTIDRDFDNYFAKLML